MAIGDRSYARMGNAMLIIILRNELQLRLIRECIYPINIIVYNCKVLNKIIIINKCFSIHKITRIVIKYIRNNIVSLLEGIVKLML